jgi:O-antigen ligase
MIHYDIKQHNFHDFFIIFIVTSAIVGTVQIGLLGFTFVAGILCLPAAIREIYTTFREKAHPIIVFMIFFLLYAIISVIWAPRHQFLLREIWCLLWNTIIFFGLFNHARYATNANDSLLRGLRMLIFLTLIVATWEISTDSHIPEFGDFNEGAEIATESGFEHRLFAAVTYKNLNSYVTLLCMALPFLTYSIFILPNKWFSLISVIGSIIVLIINSSRGGLMCLVIDVFIFTFLYRKQHFAYKKTITFLSIVAIIFFTYRFGLILAEQALGRLSSYKESGIMYDSGRWDLWKMGVQFCFESKGVGYGVGSMQPIYASTGFRLHYAHNMVIEFLIQYGIWLFIPFGILLFKNWILLIKENNSAHKMLGLMLLTSFIPLVIIDDSYLTHAFFWIWLAMQFIITNNIKQHP